jgi:hypothetical protein
MKLSATPLLLLPALTVAAPPSASINSITYNGSGCPAGSLAASLTRDNTQLSISYNDMVAVSGTSNRGDKRKFCQFNVNLRYPPGWALTVVNNKFEGYISIDAGVTAEVVSSYYFSGSGLGDGNDVSLIPFLKSSLGPM